MVRVEMEGEALKYSIAEQAGDRASSKILVQFCAGL